MSRGGIREGNGVYKIKIHYIHVLCQRRNFRIKLYHRVNERNSYLQNVVEYSLLSSHRTLSKIGPIFRH